MTFKGDLTCLCLFEGIVRERCEHIATLRTRGRDHLDFHDISVWALLDILQSAYDAGYAARTQGGSP